MLLALAHAEVTYLAGYLGRLRSWDEWAAVRLQVRGEVVGVYSALPMGALALVALPLAGRPPESGPGGLDVTVLAGRLRDILGDVSATASGAGGVREVLVPDPVEPTGMLGRLPPRTGWQAGDSGLAGDLAPLVAAAVDRYRAQVPAGSLMAELEAAQAWDGPGWGQVPLGALHAASLLGFLANPQAPVRSATTPGWRRLVTPGGQVFVPLADSGSASEADTSPEDSPPGRP